MQSPPGENQKTEERNVNDNTPKDSKNEQENNQSIFAQQEIQEYIQEEQKIHDNLIKFLENGGNDDDFKNLINIISQQEHEEPQEKLEQFLRLTTNIANNFHPSETFFKKIFQIIEYYEVQIKQTLSNKIFNIFENNKKLLLFIFKKEIITIDNFIIDQLLSKIESNGNRYYHFFYPEIKNFIGDEKSKFIEKELLEKDSNIFDHFEENREEGENDTFICSLIRKDSIDEFISYVNQTNISLNSEINSSIFETNSFLIENKNTSLIEYAAFFGSISIVKYLMLNNVELKPSLWLYAIHSENAEIINLLEENKIDPPAFKSSNEEEEDKDDDDNDNLIVNDYLNCFCESIKCHHNDIAIYIENNYLSEYNDKLFKNEKVLSSIMQFHNYAFFPSNLEDDNEFYYLCSNNYHKLVNLFIKKKEESIKKEISEKINFLIFIKSP